MDSSNTGTGVAAAVLTAAALAAIPATASPTSQLEARPVPPVVLPAPALITGPRPLNDPATWVTTSDYPPPALRENAEGATGFRLEVGPDGQVTDCQIQRSAGSPLLDEATCRLVRLRARFNPATDASGKPIAGFYSNRIRWVIPRPARPEPGELTLSYLVGPDGSRSDCRVEAATGGAAKAFAKSAPCPPGGSYASGYVDEAGKPVSRRVRTTMKIEVLPVP